MQQSMIYRNRMLIVGAVALGLLLLMAGGIVYNLGAAHVVPTSDSPEQVVSRYNLQNVWAPVLWDLGMLFFVGGIVLAAIVVEEMDPFVRLFLLILAFVALLLILANPSTIFG
jgi:hypothetical protein